MFQIIQFYFFPMNENKYEKFAAKPYPLMFENILKRKIWGGRNLKTWVNKKLPNGLYGEAWLLSDRENDQSIISNGCLKGVAIGEALKSLPKYIFGKLYPKYKQFPLLLKILDVTGKLSIQVHPSEENEKLIPFGEMAKTEAWVVLSATKKSKIYAGLNSKTDLKSLECISQNNVNEIIPSFSPQAGQAIFIKAGIVHSAADGVLILEIQQNSDITFRLYDWEKIDLETNMMRSLQIENALECIDLNQGKINPVHPIIELKYPVLRELVFKCPFFIMWRITGSQAFDIGEIDLPTIMVCIKGNGELFNLNSSIKVKKGGLILMPAALGLCRFQPNDEAIILIIKIPLI